MDVFPIDSLVQKHGGDSSALIGILQDVQREQGYLSKKTLSSLSERMDFPLSRLYGLATFYRSFSLKPAGRHRIGVCMGTACHVRGGHALLDRLERDLAVKTGNTTMDRKFTLETVRCLGCCSIGPVVRIDDDTFGKLRQDKLGKLLGKYE